MEGDNTVVTSFTYDSENRLTQSVTGNATTYYGYDNNGNQISEWTRITNVAEPTEGVNLGLQNGTTDDLLTLYAYDAFDRLIRIEQGADVIENAYTADGKKLSRTTNGNLTYYVYDGNVVIEEQDEDNDETSRNVYGRNLITRETSDNKIVYGFNGHGDVVYYANLDNIVLVVYDYDEFGNVISEEYVINSVSTLAPSLAGTADSATETIWASTDSIDNPYRYAGYEYIEEVKLYDLNARYYNPEIARFLSPDPYYNLGNRVIGLYEINVPNVWSIIQANNLYVYCGNNSVLFYDPTGFVVTAWDEANCTDAEIERLHELTKIWELANAKGDSMIQQAVHEEAEQIRNQYRKDGEHGFGDGNTGKNNIKYHTEYWLSDAVITEGPQFETPKIIDVDFNMGVGFGVKPRINGINVKAMAVVKFDMIEDSVASWNNDVRERTAEASIGMELTENTKLGAGYTYVYDYNTSEPITQSGYVGCSYKNLSCTYDDDFVLSLGAEGYFVVGGGAFININLSEAGRRIFD